MRISRTTVVAPFLLFSVLAGCARTPAPEVPEVRVSGTVTLDGTPLSGATVTFIPVGSTRGERCFVQTDKSGKYELKNRHGRLGTPAGEYKVTCTMGGGPGSDASAGGVENAHATPAVVIPLRYGSEHETDLKATVPAGGGTIDFRLTSKK